MSALPAGLAIGADVTPIEIAITRGVVVATAIATRDYQDVHHDPDSAQASGNDDVFLNILTSNAYAERLVMEWAGPTARLAGLRLRLGLPCYPGDVLKLSGEVTAAEGARAELAIRGTHTRGAHFTGTATVTWHEAEES